MPKIPTTKPTTRTPRVSIVLPVFNGEKFLAQSIKSVIKQTFKDWELIIVDDCSTDDTLNIANGFAKQDDRIIVVRNKQNKKLPASLNVGFTKARGELFTWTSDDNIAKPNWLKTLVDFLDKNPDIDMVSATMDYIDESGNFLFKTTQPKSPVSLSYKSNVGAAFMYRKSIAEKIGEYDENTFCAEDYDYWCRIALSGNLKYIPENIYKYRVNTKSLTALEQPRIKQKTAYIQEKYFYEFIEKFHLNYWQRSKLEYLVRRNKYKPIFVLFDAYKFLLKNAVNLFLFWNKKLRRKTYEKYSVQI